MSHKKKLPIAAKGGVHAIVPELLTRRVRVALVGAGGNGSQMLSGLARLHLALLKLGHPGGLSVTVWDPDLVSESNVGRQLFYPSDIGQPKSFVLVNRFNLAFGFDWDAEGDEFERPQNTNPANIVVSCVDSAKARRSVREHIWDQGYNSPNYWLDLGNRQRDGQVVLGQPMGSVRYASVMSQVNSLCARDALNDVRLPCVTDLFPDLLDESIEEDNAPSCSLAEALTKQDLFINQAVSTFALQLLWRLFREGKIEHHGAFINLESGRVNPLPVPAHIGVQIENGRREIGG